MPLRYVIMACLSSCLVGGQAADPSAETTAHVERLLVELAGTNEELRTPGAEMRELPLDALPLLHAAQQRSDLEWQQRIAVDIAVGTIEARSQGKDIDAAMAPEIDEMNDRLVGRYRRSGVRDERWNDLVERAFALVAKEWSRDPRREGNEVDQALPLLKQALAAGCTDPYVCYVAARMHQIQGDGRDDAVETLLTRAADGMPMSGYHPQDKIYALWRATLQIMWKSQWKPAGHPQDCVKRWLGAIPGLVLETARMPQVSRGDLFFLADAYLDILQRWTGDREPGYRALIAQLDQAMPNSALPRLVEADFALAWAWDARGGGWAQSVTDAGWKLMRERMDLCRHALEVAGARDPKLPDVDHHWLSCANGLDMAKGEVKDHLTRVIVLGGWKSDALIAVEGYLEPKWHGSADELLRLGHRCLATGDFDEQVPDILLTVHHSLSEYSDGDKRPSSNPVYFSQPQVWRDVQAVFEGALKRRPHDLKMRSKYVWYAHLCGHLDVARAQNALLEGHPCLAGFGGKKSYDAIQAELTKVEVP